MALSSIHDVTGHHAAAAPHHPHHPHHLHQHPHQANPISRIQHVVIDHEKHFRPNPDAKPFIPNMAPSQFHAANNWHFFQGENPPKSINGMIPPFWMGTAMIDNENMLAPGSSTTSSKQHIAFHLVSNVLDDEIPEDKEMLTKAQLHHQLHHTMSQNQMSAGGAGGNELNELVNNWHESAVNFTLPIEAEKSASSDKSSINNKSIHEIWSPDPSPSDLSNVANNEEILNTYKQPQQQVVDSPNSTQSATVENSDSSFEQLPPNENVTQQTNKTKHVDNQPEDKDHQTTSQPNQNDVPSPVYRQHYYETNHRHMYHGYHKNMMYPNMRPPVMDPNYYPPSHYYPRYPYYGGPPNYKNRQKHYGDQGGIPPPSTIYNGGGISAVEELGIGIDECRDQLKHLERDCKKADLNLLQNFRLRKSSFNESGSTKYPTNSSRIDKLIIDQEKEHQKVESLIGRIERLGFTPMHPNVGVALDSWFTSIKDLRSSRKNEITNMHEMGDGVHTVSKSHTQADVCNLIGSVKDLTKHTRAARTIVWCALQMLYANSSSGASSGSGD